MGEKGLIEAIFEDSEILYECISKMSLPSGSDDLVTLMARHALSTPVICGIKNINIDKIPFYTFCLGEVLTSAFPKDVKTNIFKMTLGSSYVDGWSKEEVDNFEIETEVLCKEYSLHRRFAGLGVILMKQARSVLGELLSDQDIVRLAVKEDLFLVFLLAYVVFF